MDRLEVLRATSRCLIVIMSTTPQPLCAITVTHHVRGHKLLRVFRKGKLDIAQISVFIYNIKLINFNCTCHVKSTCTKASERFKKPFLFSDVMYSENIKPSLTAATLLPNPNLWFFFRWKSKRLKEMNYTLSSIGHLNTQLLHQSKLFKRCPLQAERFCAQLRWLPHCVMSNNQ